MQSDVAEALCCLTRLYNSDEYLREFVIAVTGDESNFSQELLIHSLLDALCEEFDVHELLSSLSDASWKEYVGQRTVTPLIQSIEEEITLAKKTKGEGCTVRLNAGNKLKNATRENLQTLKQLLPVDDIRYQMIADKLGIEILQCGIDYYNGSDATDAARNAMILQKYALSIVVGKLAKDRCQENVNILQKIIDNLPPSEVFMEDRAIHEELRKYCLLPDKICHAVTLLNNTKPHIQSIKRKLGVSNAYYLKISTQIVGNALSNVIAEVNEAQSIFSADKDDPNDTLAAILGITHLKSVLKEAWKATRIMDDFDMEVDYKCGRYSQNRSILKGLCEQLGFSTSTYTPSSSSSRPTQREPTSTARSYASTTNRASANRQTTSTNNYSSSSSNSSSNNGCLIAFIVWIVLGCIAGTICAANDGDFVAGFCIAGVLVLIGCGLFNQ